MIGWECKILLPKVEKIKKIQDNSLNVASKSQQGCQIQDHYTKKFTLVLVNKEWQRVSGKLSQL